jgi:hypothetical protein
VTSEGWIEVQTAVWRTGVRTVNRWSDLDSDDLDRGTDGKSTVGLGLRRLDLDRGTDGGSLVRLGRLEWDRGGYGGASNGVGRPESDTDADGQTMGWR